MKKHPENPFNHPALTCAAAAVFIALAYTSQHTKRPTCEDLGKCNLKTGQVYSTTPDDWTPEHLKPEIAAQIVYLYGEK